MKIVTQCMLTLLFPSCCADVYIGDALAYRFTETPSGIKSIGLQMEQVRKSPLHSQLDHIPDLPLLLDGLCSPPAPP